MGQGSVLSETKAWNMIGYMFLSLQEKQLISEIG